MHDAGAGERHAVVTGSQTVVEGPLEYSEMVRKLQKVLVPFILARSRARSSGIDQQLPRVKEVPIHVNLTAKQRKIYDDFIVEPDNQVSWSL